MAPRWSDRNSSELDLSLADAFRESAEANASRIALDNGLHRTSYGELQVITNRLAHRLIESGCAPSDRIAILMAHNIAAIAALVGVVKAGCVTLGLSDSDPVTRLKQLVEDAEPFAIVADAANLAMATELAGLRSKLVLFDLQEGAEPGKALPNTAKGADIAALVYTSGSSGRPKGVMKTHRQICRNVATHSRAMQYSGDDRIPLFSAIGTGQGTTVIWCALLNGATLCPFPIRTRGFAGLAKWISDIELSVLVASASILRALVGTLTDETVFGNIRAVRFASESVTGDDVRLARRHFSRSCVFVHTLSSSETGNIAWSRWNAGDEMPDGQLPVGNVSRDIEVLLLGDDGQPVAPGETGEIVVRSRYTAAGYWRDPVLSAERFSPELDDAGTRSVHSGDLARLGASGRLEFRGRKDSRIKIRGYRIDLSEVEQALRGIPGIANAAVVVLPRKDAMLAAFVVLAPEASLSPRQIRQSAAANLPPQMLPSRFVTLDTLPLGASGKVDRELLRARDTAVETPVLAAGDRPTGSTEALLADVWAEALDVSAVGRDDDFFEAGGDSLKAAVVSAEVYAQFGVELSLAAFAVYPTVAAMANYLDAETSTSTSSLPEITRISRSEPIPLSPYQERIWNVLQRRSRHSTLARSYEILGPLDRAAMERAFGFLVERHEMFRTTFSVVRGQPAQTVHASGPSMFSFVDLSGEEDPVAAAERFCSIEATKPIEASVLPTVKLILLRLGAELQWLLRIGHVLGQDPSSFAMIMKEFATLYEADVRGLPPPFAKKPALQYVDFAVWHREVMQPQGPAYRQSLDWWKTTFARRLPATKLPFRIRSKRDAEVTEATQRWHVNSESRERLDSVARQSGATHFTARLACFLALLAHTCGTSTVVVGTSFTKRPRNDTSSIAGLFTNLAPLVIEYKPELDLTDWVRAVRDRLFETEMHSSIPLETLYDSLYRSGLRPPPIKILFTMASDWAEERFAGITIRRRPHPLPEMPWGFQVFADRRTPTNCRIEFDTRLYRPDDVKKFADAYVRLLTAAGTQSQLTIGALVSKTSPNTLGNIVSAIRRFVSRFEI